MAPTSIRKAKSVIVLKRIELLRKHFNKRSIKPLYNKLKNNNNYLAKALAQEKQNSQSLFSQNLALTAEVQNLNLICNKRNSIVSEVLKNAKEMLKMVVTMSSYVTSTISMCQELANTDTAARLSSISSGRKESSKRLSKSPTKGVVKPMVGGHTIKKPTINLSRVNMNNINISRLSNIAEISETSGSTPNNSQEMNEERSPVILPLPATPLRYENEPVCRMPERISSLRISDTLGNEPILRRKKNRHSPNLSESYSLSRSNRWSEINETSRNSSGHINLGSPRVKLKDVSKLLKDSHTINIRRLRDSKVNDIEIQESSDEAPHNVPNKTAISESQISINLDDETDEEEPKKESRVQTNNKASDKDFNRSHLDIMEISKVPQSNARNWEEDPLEGPSWLFNNNVAMPLRDNEPEELDQLNISDVNNNTQSEILYDESISDAESVEEPLSSPTLARFVGMQNLERNEPFVEDRTRCNSYNNEEDTVASFVTMKRGNSKVFEEEEDFTLMLQMKQNVPFDINELRLPEEECVINSATDNEIDTNAVMNTPTSPILNVSSRYSRNDQGMVKSPICLIDNYDKASIITSDQKSNLIKRGKKTKIPSMKDEKNNTENTVSTIKNKKKQRSELENNRDPSAAKVVLEKLNESHVKSKTSFIDDTESRNSNNNHMRDVASYREESSGESESSNSSSRPKRRKVPINLKEPSLRKKMRRNK